MGSGWLAGRHGRSPNLYLYLVFLVCFVCLTTKTLFLLYILYMFGILIHYGHEERLLGLGLAGLPPRKVTKPLFFQCIFLCLVCHNTKTLLSIPISSICHILTHYGHEMRLGQVEAHFFPIVCQNTKNKNYKVKRRCGCYDIHEIQSKNEGLVIFHGGKPVSPSPMCRTSCP